MQERIIELLEIIIANLEEINLKLDKGMEEKEDILNNSVNNLKGTMSNFDMRKEADRYFDSLQKAISNDHKRSDKSTNTYSQKE